MHSTPFYFELNFGQWSCIRWSFSCTHTCIQNHPLKGHIHHTLSLVWGYNILGNSLTDQSGRCGPYTQCDGGGVLAKKTLQTINVNHSNMENQRRRFAWSRTTSHTNTTNHSHMGKQVLMKNDYWGVSNCQRMQDVLLVWDWLQSGLISNTF